MKVPREKVNKITELSILVPSAVRIIEDARIMDLTATHVLLRYRKPRSSKRWEQLFPMSQVLFIRDKGVESAEEAAADAAADAAESPEAARPAVAKRICDAVVIDTFQLDEYADIASIDKLEGTKVFATTVEGFKIIGDTSICRFVQDVAASAKAATVTLSDIPAAGAPAPSKATGSSRPARATAKFD